MSIKNLIPAVINLLPALPIGHIRGINGSGGNGPCCETSCVKRAASIISLTLVVATPKTLEVDKRNYFC